MAGIIDADTHISEGEAMWAMFDKEMYPRRPVMLKRGLAMTIDEWLQAAEYVAQRGNSEIILCERGIRTF